MFVRLWRKLRESCRGGYSFAQLRDICDVLQLQAGGAANPDFIRQLAAFQMLRDDFGLELTDPAAPLVPGAVGRRPHAPAGAVDRAVGGRVAVGGAAADRAGRAARAAAARPRAAPGRVRQAADREPRSAVPAGGVRPGLGHRLLARAADAHAAVRRGAGQGLRLRLQRRRADLPVHRRTAPGRRRPVPAAGRERRAGRPARAAGRRARARPVAAAPRAARGGGRGGRGGSRGRAWPWRRIEAALQAEFGFAPADITALGQHFFPGVLARAGTRPVQPRRRAS